MLKKDKELLYVAGSCNHPNSVVFFSFALISILIAFLLVLNQWLLHIAFSNITLYTRHLLLSPPHTNIGPLSDFHCGTHINACVADTMNSTFRLPPSPLNDDARGNHNMIALPKHDSRGISRLLFHLFSTDYVWERP